MNAPFLVDQIKKNEDILETSSTPNLFPFPIVGSSFQLDLDDIFKASRAALIIRDPAICQGDPIIRDTRIAVANIIELHYVLGWDIHRIREQFPHLKDEEIRAALDYYDQNKAQIDQILQNEKEEDDL